jgi:HK97 family phage portal protein
MRSQLSNAKGTEGSMRIAGKEWSGAPSTLAREVQTTALVATEPEVKAAPFYPEDLGLYFGNYSSGALLGFLREVGMGLDSNVVMAPVMWIMRTFTEAVARVQSRTATEVAGVQVRGVWKWIEDHPLELLLERPNEFYNGDALWKATAISYTLDGNAYWWKIRNRFGDVIALWYLPHWLVNPQWPRGEDSTFLSHYEYRPLGGADPVNIAPRDMLHFRFGIDPENPRKGFSPLRVLLREVYVDDEAQNFSAQILKNMGVPGLLISPKGDKFTPSKDEVERLKAYLQTAFSGQNMGKPMVMQQPTDVQQFGFDPNKLMLGALRDIAEERVCAVLGLPAAVVGFGSGMQSTKVGATMRELRRLAWVQCLTPMQKSMAKEIDSQLLPDFQAQRRRFRCRFDTTDVAAYQEDDDALYNRVNTAVQGGWLRVDRAQEMAGLEVDETQKVYLRPSNAMPVDEAGEPIQRAAPAGAVQGGGETEAEEEVEEIPEAVLARQAENGNGNGNGRRRGD